MGFDDLKKKSDPRHQQSDNDIKKLLKEVPLKTNNRIEVNTSQGKTQRKQITVTKKTLNTANRLRKIDGVDFSGCVRAALELLESIPESDRIELYNENGINHHHNI